MPEIKTTVYLELEVTISYTQDRDCLYEDVEIQSIKGLTPTIQLNTVHDLDKFSATGKPMKLTPWLQVSDELEKIILEQAHDDLCADVNEGPDPDSARDDRIDRELMYGKDA